MNGRNLRPDLREVVLDAADWRWYVDRLGQAESPLARHLGDGIARAMASAAPPGAGPVVVVLAGAERALLHDLVQQELDEWFAATDGGEERSGTA